MMAIGGLFTISPSLSLSLCLLYHLSTIFLKKAAFDSGNIVDFTCSVHTSEETVDMDGGDGDGQWRGSEGGRLAIHYSEKWKFSINIIS